MIIESNDNNVDVNEINDSYVAFEGEFNIIFFSSFFNLNYIYIYNHLFYL